MDLWLHLPANKSTRAMADIAQSTTTAAPVPSLEGAAQVTLILNSGMSPKLLLESYTRSVTTARKAHVSLFLFMVSIC